jgi:hypothetical protein
MVKRESDWRVTAIVASELNVWNVSGCTPTYLAAYRHLEVVRYLLEQCGENVDVDARDKVVNLIDWLIDWFDSCSLSEWSDSAPPCINERSFELGAIPKFVGKLSFDLTALSLSLSVTLSSRFVHHFAMTFFTLLTNAVLNVWNVSVRRMVARHCMGLHRRLGVDSPLNMLNVDVMQEIAKFVDEWMNEWINGVWLHKGGSNSSWTSCDLLWWFEHELSDAQCKYLRGAAIFSALRFVFSDEVIFASQHLHVHHSCSCSCYL